MPQVPKLQFDAVPYVDVPYFYVAHVYHIFNCNRVQFV